MNKKLLLLLSVLCLAACSSGGGGGDDDTPQSPAPSENSQENNQEESNPPSPETPVEAPASKATLGSVSGYTYISPDGKEYTLRGGGISAGGTTTMASGATKTSWCCGRMSYTNYGTWSNSDTNQHGVFYTGEATAASSVPTQGTATYTGTGMRNGASSVASFNVDFAARTINGNIDAAENFGSAIAMQGSLNGGGFSGSAETDGQTGTFTGHFYGPQAQELGGMAEFADNAKSASFGAAAN
ncbi:Slam-dependent surface lipoprotein [Entomohabitans teleogrylli]|uniref:Slam-dependent surface lipoprotein n=1 Tax=Entomohabitans teleogrylli TaxID=1384589 RepID=UPI00073D9024|nr:Slam-dependent surface lipoprotein [Entomohabitans teleogrylli]